MFTSYHIPFRIFEFSEVAIDCEVVIAIDTLTEGGFYDVVLFDTQKVVVEFHLQLAGRAELLERRVATGIPAPADAVAAAAVEAVVVLRITAHILFFVQTRTLVCPWETGGTRGVD